MGGEKEGWWRTFDQLSAVRCAVVELQGHDVALRLVEELDGDADRGCHVCGRWKGEKGGKVERCLGCRKEWW